MRDDIPGYDKIIEQIDRVRADAYQAGYEVGRQSSYELRRFGPKAPDHPSGGNPCPACHNSFTQGDYTTLISLGPGDDPQEQEKARTGRPYNAVAVEVHYLCATGRAPEGS